MTFDPDHLRQSLFGYIIQSARDSDLFEASKINALEGNGSGVIHCCLECFLVGLFDVGRELLPKAHTFLQTAIERDEVPVGYRRGATEALRFEALSLCTWLMEGRHDAESLHQVVRWQELAFAERGDSDKVGVQFSLAAYLDAGEYATLVDRFEHAKIKPPKALRQIRGEGSMAYVIARQRLGLQYTAEEVHAALETFLKRNVPDWLGYKGDKESTARWMKIAFWKPGDDPIATLLKCYDYLRGFKPRRIRDDSATRRDREFVILEEDFTK